MPKIKINDTEYYYELHGKGQPLVLIAGYTSDHQMFMPVLAPLAQHFQVLLFDNRAVGQTRDNGSLLSAEGMADDVMALCEALNLKKPHIAGHSMGGTIAQSIASRHSDKIGKLAILCSAAKWRHAMLCGIEAVLQSRAENISFDIIFQNILAWVFGEAFLSNKEQVAFFRSILLNNPHPQSYEDQARQAKVLHAFDGKKALARIKAPTLIVSGEEDIISLPHESEFMAKTIPDAKWVELPCAHGLIAEVPELIVQTLLGFLQ